MTNPRRQLTPRRSSPRAADKCGVSSRADRIGCLLRTARCRSGLSLRELAARVGTSHATLSAYEQGRKIPSAVTLLRIVEACNLDLDFGLTPRIRHADGSARGDELAEVLILAGQFPSKPGVDLDLPTFPTHT